MALRPQPSARALVVLESADGLFHAIWYRAAEHASHTIHDPHSPDFWSETNLKGFGRHAVSTTMVGALGIVAGWAKEEDETRQRQQFGLPRGG